MINEKWIDANFYACAIAKEENDTYYAKLACNDKQYKKTFYVDLNCTVVSDVPPIIIDFGECENFEKDSQMYTYNLPHASEEKTKKKEKTEKADDWINIIIVNNRFKAEQYYKPIYILIFKNYLS